MTSEREIISLGFGNYSTLVAAQWANSTSEWDVHHKTLYTDRTVSMVYGGSGGGPRHHVRVPRLVLLDAPHAVRMEELHAAAQKEGEVQAVNAGNSTQDTEELASEVAEDASLLVSQPGAGRGTQTRREWNTLGKALHDRQPWEWRRVAALDDEDEVEERNAADERARRWRDASYEEEEDEEEEEQAKGEKGEHLKAGGPQEKSFAAIKRGIFNEVDAGVVPWWHYIATGLGKDSVVSLRPPQQVEATNDIPAMHSFGFGLSHLRDGGSAREMEVMLDSVRRQMEDADAMQGLQCFVDADTMFGGAAYNTLQTLWEDAGTKLSAVVAAAFQALPSVLTDKTQQSDISFADRRREECHLNRLLATCRLSEHPSAVYIPLEVGKWTEFFADHSSTSTRRQPQWMEDDRATAQCIAAFTDTALFGARDGGGLHHQGHSGEEADGAGPCGVSSDASGGPAYYLSEWCRTVRPSASMRVAAMLGAMPLRLRREGSEKRRELWDFMQATPLLGARCAAVTAALTARDGEEEGARTATGSLAGSFVPLSHAMSYSPLEERGRVVGHAVSLRGAGVLPSAVYPAREAMLRYALPLRSSTYLPLLTRTNLPISQTFPLSLIFDEASMPANMPESEVRRHLGGVDLGSHVVSTYTSAVSVRETLDAVKRVILPQHHCPHWRQHQVLYGMDNDEWMEVLEDVTQIYDDYHHSPPSNDVDDDEEDIEW